MVRWTSDGMENRRVGAGDRNPGASEVTSPRAY